MRVRLGGQFRDRGVGRPGVGEFGRGRFGGVQPYRTPDESPEHACVTIRKRRTGNEGNVHGRIDAHPRPVAVRRATEDRPEHRLCGADEFRGVFGRGGVAHSRAARVLFTVCCDGRLPRGGAAYYVSIHSCPAAEVPKGRCPVFSPRK